MIDELPEPLSAKQLDGLCLQLPLIESWVSAVKAEVTRRLEAGQAFTNARMVPKRAMRSWIDEEQAKAYLGLHLLLDEYYPRRLLSPAQAEDVLSNARRKELAQFTQKVSSGLTLALGVAPVQTTKD